MNVDVCVGGSFSFDLKWVFESQVPLSFSYSDSFITQSLRFLFMGSFMSTSLYNLQSRGAES